MAALGWLLNLGFAGTAGEVSLVEGVYDYFPQTATPLTYTAGVQSSGASYTAGPPATAVVYRYDPDGTMT